MARLGRATMAKRQAVGKAAHGAVLTDLAEHGSPHLPLVIIHSPSLTRRAAKLRITSPGANLGATRMNSFLHKADGYGQSDGDHPSPRTDPDETERLTCIYGSDALRSLSTPNLPSLTASP